MTTFEGVLPALITPFTPDGAAIDADAMHQLVERCVAAGVGGLVPTGSTGEFTSLTVDERHDVIDHVVAAADGRVPTIPGTGAMTTAETVELSEHAERAGAAAVMIVPPYYTPPAWPEIVEHVAAVSARVSIPIMYYHLPDATGITPTDEQWAELAGVGVTHFKDTGGDFVRSSRWVLRPGDTPTLLNGYDTLSFAAMATGVRGVVWGLGSFLPGPCVELHRLLIVEPDLVAARALWSKLWPICDLLESVSYASAVKAGCRAVGLDTGPVRRPALEVDTGVQRRLAELIDAVGVPE